MDRMPRDVPPLPALIALYLANCRSIPARAGEPNRSRESRRAAPPRIDPPVFEERRVTFVNEPTWLAIAADLNRQIQPGQALISEADVFAFLSKIDGDVVYLDPPYAGTQDYGQVFAAIDAFFGWPSHKPPAPSRGASRRSTPCSMPVGTCPPSCSRSTTPCSMRRHSKPSCAATARRSR